MPRAAHGETCPWLNAATAQGILGGTVRIDVSHPSPNADLTVCRFTTDAGAAELSIVVAPRATGLPQLGAQPVDCGSSGKKLIGVGNDATQCEMHRDGNLIAMVSGRVRDRLFTVRWSGPEHAAHAKDTINSQVEVLSEMVAGALF
jgi:hypothetical protein